MFTDRFWGADVIRGREGKVFVMEGNRNHLVCGVINIEIDLNLITEDIDWIGKQGGEESKVLRYQYNGTLEFYYGLDEGFFAELANYNLYNPPRFFNLQAFNDDPTSRLTRRMIVMTRCSLVGDVPIFRGAVQGVTQVPISFRGNELTIPHRETLLF